MWGKVKLTPTWRGEANSLSERVQPKRTCDRHSCCQLGLKGHNQVLGREITKGMRGMAIGDLWR
jgi:hypothetical protein